MRILLTGAEGFVGHHVIDALVYKGHVISNLGLEENTLPGLDASFMVDLRDAHLVSGVIKKWMPEACIHLAGISHVPTARDNPQLAADVNLKGTINLLEGFRKHSPKTRILVVTSAEVYGKSPLKEPVTEDTILNPNSMYAITKAAADMATRQYAHDFGLHVMTARPENHIGPGQSEKFVTSSFALQLARMKLDNTLEKTMHVGNLESKRGFLDVRDVVRAYVLLLEKGVSGEAYNIASTGPQPIQTMLEHLMQISGVQAKTEINKDFFRPTDASPIYSTEKILRDTGWRAEIPLEETLQCVFEDALQRAT